MFFTGDIGLEPSLFSRVLPYLMLVGAILFIYKMKDKLRESRYEKVFRYGFASYMVALELWFFYFTFVYKADMDWYKFWVGNTMIPIHMCALSLWLAVLVGFTKNKKIFRFALFTGMMGPILTIVSGDVEYSFDRLRYWHFYGQHINTMVFLIYLHLVHGLKIFKGDWIKMSGIMFLLASFVLIPINMILDSNFMYVYNTNGSPLEVIENWILAYVVIIIVTIIFFRLTEFVFVDLKKKKTNS